MCDWISWLCVDSQGISDFSDRNDWLRRRQAGIETIAPDTIRPSYGGARRPIGIHFSCRFTASEGTRTHQNTFPWGPRAGSSKGLGSGWWFWWKLKIHYDPIVLNYFGLRAKIMIFQESQDDFGGNSRSTMTQLYYIFLVWGPKSWFFRKIRICQARYASLCFKPVVSQERKSTVFMKKYKWPSKDARGTAHHFGGRTDSIGQDLRG